jgi:hypothetical protein
MMSPAPPPTPEILAGFDVDPCAVGYDSKQVWLAGRAHNAITSQIIPIDLSRRSPSYEMRLAKYASRGGCSATCPAVCAGAGSHPCRPGHPYVPRVYLWVRGWAAGFEVAVVGLDRARIDPMIFERSWTVRGGACPTVLGVAWAGMPVQVALLPRVLPCVLCGRGRTLLVWPSCCCWRS